MVSFFTAGSEKKTPVLVQLKQIFGPSYFIRALGSKRCFFNQDSPEGGVQVLCQQVFDLFRPNHPPYQQRSALPYTHLTHDIRIS